MAINFNELPNTKPNALLTKGRYRLKILKAEMTKSKTAGRPDYLNVTYQVYDDKGAELTKLYDMITEPDKDVTRFKVQRFVRALGVQLASFELKDLTKFAAGKEFYGDVTTQAGTNGYQDKNVIDVFAGDIFYIKEDLPALDDYIPGEGGDEPVFDAPDADDAGGPSY